MLVAWVDLNRNGRLDVGDHVSDPTVVLDGVELSLRHIWVTRLASNPPRPMRVVFDLPASEPPTHGRILLLGWDELTGGSIPRTPPTRTWRSERRRREWRLEMRRQGRQRGQHAHTFASAPDRQRLT